MICFPYIIIFHFFVNKYKINIPNWEIFLYVDMKPFLISLTFAMLIITFLRNCNFYIYFRGKILNISIMMKMNIEIL